jgi:hypothetical protein
MATPITSFWFAIYKRLWAIGIKGVAHVSVEIASDGNFSLESTVASNGIFGTNDYGAPLAAGDFTAAHNPLFVILNASLNNPPASNLVPVPPGNAMWPVMPWPPSGPYPLWTGWNAGASPYKLIDRLQNWIEVDQKLDDTPKGTYLDFTSFVSQAPPAFPLKPNETVEILFVASFPQDNGVRPGSVPPNYWDTSLIFVTDQHGQDQGLPAFGAGQEYYIAAVIGNSGNGFSGSIFNNTTPTINVVCNAHVFSTFESPAVALPALSNLNPADTNPTYEQYYMQKMSRDVVGFRFNVDLVYAGLLNVMAGFTLAQLGGLTPDAWLKKVNAHACVKVLILSGELPNAYNNNGDPNAWPTDKTVSNNVESLPSVDRHIGQRNLAAFDSSVKGMKKVQWQDFMMSQAGTGTNALAVASALPPEAMRTLVAVPTAMYERYVAKGGSHRGFEQVKDVGSKPFPDAVILHQTAPGARLEIAEHGREPFFAMALGVELLKEVRPADIAMVHTAQDGRVVGGFTLRSPLKM